MTRQRRHAWQLGVVLSGTVAVVALAAGPASAHVTVDPDQATQGGFTTLTFRVPSEADEASTTRLEVALPTDTPIASVSVTGLIRSERARIHLWRTTRV